MSHFYEDTGKDIAPRHFVPLKSRPDELRPTRITDARKWWKEGRLVVPSVTTVLNVLNKGALNNWKIDQHLFQAHRVDPKVFPSREAYVAEVKRLTELEMDLAPKAGTDIHDKLERLSLNELTSDDPDYQLCVGVMHEVMERTGHYFQLRPEPEVRFVSPLGFGGCADLVFTDPDPWVIDYKSKATADKFKPGKMAYDDHRAQLAAYREGLGIPSARAANVFICLENGEVDFHEHNEQELQRGWDIFSHALEVWKIQNNFPSELAEAA